MGYWAYRVHKIRYSSIPFILHSFCFIAVPMLSLKYKNRGRSAGGTTSGKQVGPALALASASFIRNFSLPSPNTHLPIFTMLSLRAFSRAAPRFSRSIARTSLRPAVLPKSTFVQPWKQVAKPAYANFSTTSVFRESAAEGK